MLKILPTILWSSVLTKDFSWLSWGPSCLNLDIWNELKRDSRIKEKQIYFEIKILSQYLFINRNSIFLAGAILPFLKVCCVLEKAKFSVEWQQLWDIHSNAEQIGYLLDMFLFVLCCLERVCSVLGLFFPSLSPSSSSPFIPIFSSFFFYFLRHSLTVYPSHVSNSKC